MWNNNDYHATMIFPSSSYKGFSTPPPPSSSSNLRPSFSSSMSECKKRSPANRGDNFHVIHKVPAGNSPYVRAKQVQLIEKDPSRAISHFWSAINAGDRVDSALKDMAIVMKQLDRSDEAIEAIKSFRHLCPSDSQESIDNVLVELYKRAGRIDEEIDMLQNKLKCIEEGTAFGGRRTKTARSQGKKVQITIVQEKSRILGNLAWAYLQKNNYVTAEEYYRRALLLESDKNKQCNLAICLMQMNRIAEAKSLLQGVRASSGHNPMDEAYAKSFQRAQEMLTKLEAESVSQPLGGNEKCRREMPISSSSPMVPPRWSDDAKKNETRRFEERNTESCCGSPFENNANFKDDFSVHDEDRISQFMSFRGESTFKFTQQAVSSSKLKNDYFENSGEWRSRFAGLQNNCKGTSGAEPSSCQKKAHFSPAPARCNVRTPFMQPRRCLWGFRDGEQRRAEGWRKQVLDNSKKNPSNTNDDWRRKKSWQNCHLNPKNSTNHESNLNQNSTAESPILLGQLLIESPKPILDSSDYKKKSWADMAEEEEEDEEPFEFYNPWKNEEASGGSPCLQTQMKTASQKRQWVWGRLNIEEEFNDENMNSNTVYQSPDQIQTQMKKVTRKLEFCDLKDENNSTGNSVWSRNQSVRRSLHYEQNGKRGDSTTAYSCSSPLTPRKDPNFDGLNSLQSTLKGSTSGNGIKLLRRNRLKVFQDITRHPESP